MWKNGWIDCVNKIGNRREFPPWLGIQNAPFVSCKSRIEQEKKPKIESDDVLSFFRGDEEGVEHTQIDGRYDRGEDRKFRKCGHEERILFFVYRHQQHPPFHSLNREIIITQRRARAHTTG